MYKLYMYKLYMYKLYMYKLYMYKLYIRYLEYRRWTRMFNIMIYIYIYNVFNRICKDITNCRFNNDVLAAVLSAYIILSMLHVF